MRHSKNSPPIGPLRFVDYARVSTSMQAEKDLSIPAQHRENVDFGIKRGWIHIRSYEDAGMTGTTMDRPALQDMLIAARAKEFDAIVIHKSDRLSREELDALLIKAEMAELGIRMASVTESFFGSEDDDHQFLESITRAMNRRYVAKLKAEVRKGLREQAEQGRQQGQPTYGYRYKDLSHRGNGWAIDEERAPYLVRLFEKFTAGDTSIRELARWANRQGFPRPHSRKVDQSVQGWNPSTIRRIMQSRNYLGEVSYRDTWHKGNHPALIPAETFEAAQEILNVRKRRSDWPNPKGLFAGGLLRCPHCEDAGRDVKLIHAVTSHWVRKNGERGSCVLYGCRVWEVHQEARMCKSEYVGEVCQGFRISERTVLRYLTAYLEECASLVPTGALPHPAKRDRARKSQSESEGDLLRQIEQLGTVRTNYQEMAAWGNITQAELAERLATLARRREGLEERLQELRTAPEAPKDVDANEAQRLLTALRDDSMPMIVKRDMLARIIAYVTPWPTKKGLTIHLTT